MCQSYQLLNNMKSDMEEHCISGTYSLKDIVFIDLRTSPWLGGAQSFFGE